MKILILDFERWDSGITNYAVSLAAGLKEIGEDVFFAALKGKPPLEQAEEKSLRALEMKNSLDLFPLVRFVKENSIEILNPHDGKSHFLCYLLKRFLRGNVKIVRTLNSSMPVKRHPALWKKTDAFITGAGFIKKRLLEKGFPAEQIRIIYQGIDVKIILPKKRDSERGDFVVSIVARLDPVKGHRFFLEAAQQVAERIGNVRFRVVGAEENVKIKELKNLCERLELRNVEFTGFVEDVFPFMCSSDVGVISSVASEAVSRVALEWLACGVPVVASSVGCLPEIVENGRTGFVVSPGNPREIASAICKLAENRKLRETLGANARKDAESRFSKERFIGESLKFFKELS